MISRTPFASSARSSSSTGELTHQSHPIRVEADGVKQDVAPASSPKYVFASLVLEVGVGGAPDPVARTSTVELSQAAWWFHSLSLHEDAVLG